MFEFTAKELSRFWANVRKGSGCWLWAGSCFRLKDRRPEQWYGRFSLRNKWVGAHVISWMIHYGVVPQGKVVSHDCDTPCCVRPDHLVARTQAENLLDCRSKNRNANCVGERHWTHTDPETVPRGKDSFSTQHPERMLRGTALPQTKLTPEKVVRIRKLLSEGSTQGKVAAEFGIHRTAVSAIVIGRTWKHIP